MSGSSCVRIEYRGYATPWGWVTPKKTCIFRGFGAAVNHNSVAASYKLTHDAISRLRLRYGLRLRLRSGSRLVF